MNVRPSFVRMLAIAALLVPVTACTTADDAGDRTGPSPTAIGTTPAEPSATPTPPALPDRRGPRSGPVTADCVEGWMRPRTGTPLFLEPLGIIRRTTGVEGPLVVVDIRYFQGPESPPSDKGYLLLVERWYVKLYARDDLSFQGRFLVEARRFGRGLSAVAPYDTGGFRSPDWVGFQHESAAAAADAYPGLPGTWRGTPYDFVLGGDDGLSFPGLPAEVVGCLDRT